MARPQRTAQAPNTVRAPWLKLLVWLVLCALPVMGAGLLWRDQAFAVPAAAYGLMSVLAFLLYWHDKRKARQGAWRIPENLLHSAELLGGWPGALLAQQVFRHKTRKVSFQVVFWLIVIVHQLFWVDWVLLNKRFSGFLWT